MYYVFSETAESVSGLYGFKASQTHVSLSGYRRYLSPTGQALSGSQPEASLAAACQWWMYKDYRT